MRYAFYLVWFILTPLALAFVAVSLLKASDATDPTSAFGRFAWIIRDQPVPAGIVFFTLFEMVIYNFRYELPLANRAGVGGRTDLPRELRKEFEQAAHLIEEAERICSKHENDIQRDVKKSARDELTASLAALRTELRRNDVDEKAFEEAFDDATRLVEKHLGQWRKSELREYVESILIAVGVALLLRAFVVEAFKIPSGSMLPTLQIQDHIFVNKFAYGPPVPFTKKRLLTRMPPARGDVMVFESPDPPSLGQDFIKRVIALPGDTLEAEGGHPIINNWKVPNCRVGIYEYSEVEATKTGELFVEFLGERAYLIQLEEDRFEGRQGPFHVKPGEVWVMGDNRNNSSDSRAWFGQRGGGVPFANIKGRAMFVWLSFGTDGGVTWDRLLVDVMGKPRLPKGAPTAITDRIAECLAKRPSVADATPPPPGK